MSVIDIETKPLGLERIRKNPKDCDPRIDYPRLIALKGTGAYIAAHLKPTAG